MSQGSLDFNPELGEEDDAAGAHQDEQQEEEEQQQEEDANEMNDEDVHVPGGTYGKVGQRTKKQNHDMGIRMRGAKREKRLAHLNVRKDKTVAELAQVAMRLPAARWSRHARAEVAGVGATSKQA